MTPTDYTYDVETPRNLFTACFYRSEDGGRWKFEISERIHQGFELYQFLIQVQESGGRMVGFNNLHFDYPIIHMIMERKGQVSSYELYLKAQAIIGSDNPWEHTVNPKDVRIPQIDLYKIHHFDNNAKRTSLKMIENNMRSMNIKDLPFGPHDDIPITYIDTVINYNWHDTDETDKFREFTKPQIDFRDVLSKKYNKDMTNFNDTKIGEFIFIDRLEKAGVQCFQHIDGKRQPRQTSRQNIPLREVVFDWVNFMEPGFNAVKEWFQMQTITTTNGVFSDIHENRLGAVAMYAEMRERRGRPHQVGDFIPSCEWVEELKNGKRYLRYRQADTLNVVVNGFQFDFGAGGIHGSVEPQIVRSTDTHLIIDLDVASYYPNLAIANRLYPAHLSETFCDIYKEIFEERRKYDKKDPINGAYKLALNGVYGKSNSIYSCFYDPVYTMSITINGQLLLCLLAEWLMQIPGLSMVQINTDGLTVMCPRNEVISLTQISKRWEETTRLELERNDYRMMAIRDVNNYIAQDEKDGKLKRKGAYCHETPLENPATRELEWYKNHSCRVARLAAEAYLVHGTPIETFIREHDDTFDFMKCVKVPRNFRLELRYPDGTHEKLENITRYYVTNHGGTLVKVMPPLKGKTDERVNEIEAGWQSWPCNDMDSYKADICYPYYIREAQKLVERLV